MLKIDQIKAQYITKQNTLKASLFQTINTNTTLLHTVNTEIDSYFQRVQATMQTASINNANIIAALTKALSQFFKKDGIIPNIVAFGSAANQLGSLQYSDLDLSLSLFYAPSNNANTNSNINNSNHRNTPNNSTNNVQNLTEIVIENDNYTRNRKFMRKAAEAAATAAAIAKANRLAGMYCVFYAFPNL